MVEQDPWHTADGNGCGYGILIHLRISDHNKSEHRPDILNQSQKEQALKNWHILPTSLNNQLPHMCCYDNSFIVSF